MEGTMRPALLAAAIVAVLTLPAAARTDFDCFLTPQGETRCACTGVDSCQAMEASKDCVSEPDCDHGELGAVICSCTATPASRQGH
jgi:hypothetical protein